MKKFKNFILKIVNKPEANILSSQTLYESLFYLINTYEQEDEKVKKEELKVNANALALFICDYQLKDGGFDLGYDFIFGKGLHKKNLKEGTSPELLSISALALYYKKIEADPIILNSIRKGLDWVFARVIKVDNDYAIPYAPDSYDKVHITNATSFAISSLALCINLFDENIDKKIEAYVNGMYRFMSKQLEYKNETSAYWPYFYLNGTDQELALVNDKVDNYHISQQLYHHVLAQQYVPSNTNLDTIKFVLNYLISLVDEEGFAPYTHAAGKTSDKVDVWGFSSLIAGFSICSTYLENNESADCAKKVYNYLMEYCYNGNYFSPIILNSTKTVFDNHFYPRSDAWVIHALSEYRNICSENEHISQVSSQVFLLIKKNEFKGLENHTITTRKKIFAFTVGAIRSLLGKSGG